MKLQPVRIKASDFKPEQRELMENLGGTLNPFIDKLIIAFNKNFTVEDNLPFEFKILDITVDGSGNPINNSNLSTGLRNFKGYVCVSAVDLTGSNNYPTSQPFISFDVSNNTVIIRNITGLTAGIQYRLTLLGIS
jgi:hypothetical protein